MASFQRTYLLVGGAVAALVAAFPASAEEISSPVAATENSANAVITQIESQTSDTAIEVTDFVMGDFIVADSVMPTEEMAPVEATIEPEPVESSVMEEAEVIPTSEVVNSDEEIETSAETLFEEPVAAPATEPLPTNQEVAQVTRPLYRGVSPFYVGVGGNIGIIDSGNSAVGDFGFNIFSKVSLGPRFAVRPMLQFSEDDFNVALPITFNFNPIDLGRFSVYPSLGGGVDFGDDVGLLVNGGIDVPISRDFTLNSQVNWRVTEDTGLGVSLGVGYNFPVFFE